MNSEERKAKFQEIRNELLQVLWVLAILSGLAFWYLNQHAASRTTILCDAEKTAMRYGKEHFIANGYLFDGAEFRSHAQSRSGKSSMRLAGDNPFGFSLEWRELTGTETFLISVWRFQADPVKQDGQLVATISGHLYESSFEAVETDSDGWEKLELWFELSCELEHKPIRIYCWNPSGEEVYFDDLQIDVFTKATL